MQGLQYAVAVDGDLVAAGEPLAVARLDAWLEARGARAVQREHGLEPPCNDPELRDTYLDRWQTTGFVHSHTHCTQGAA